ncbi:HYC_CC_PP family protein [Tenacibaculum sp. 190524A02b]|uniref:HYC_CC_PP family protein n=1 Tax=Tenacibaculum vairaonense TaxID=3137860 RepID=UPI0031FB2A33
MKGLLKKISAVFIACLLLLSTTSFSVEKHFCGDYLVDVSFFGDAGSCAETTKDSCDSQTAVRKKKCCKDEIQHIKGQDQLKKTSLEDISFTNQTFLISYYLSSKLLFLNLEKQFVPHKNYIPPLVTTDIQVVNEVFII